MEEIIKDTKPSKMINIISQFGYRTVPLDENAISISLEDLSQIGITKCFDVENNCVIDYDNTEDLKRQHQQELRFKREPLLKAFDIYKTNVSYGIYNESIIEHNQIITWYNAILDLDEEAINNVPELIQRYL